MNGHRTKGRPLDVAIVGIACRITGAGDVFEFWRDVVEGRDRDGGEGGSAGTSTLILDAARAALDDAGLRGAFPKGCRVEVVIGRGNDLDRDGLVRLQRGPILAQTLEILKRLHPEWTAADIDAVGDDLKASLPPIEADGRVPDAVARGLGLTGSCFVVDASVASSLAAVELASRALVERRADLAIAGGVGTLAGEGVGVVVLKRLADAVRDGDRVYAVVKGVAMAGGGRSANAAKGHARATRRAHRASGIDPATVDLSEGRGVGNSAPGRAGMAALIAAALALHHRLLPSTLRADEARPPSKEVARPWVHGDTSHPRRAGVNAFDPAGNSAHAVLEEHTPSADGMTPGCMPDWETEAILLGATDRAGLVALAEALADWLDTGQNARVPLKDLAYTLNSGQSPLPFRVGMVVESTADLRAKLGRLIGRIGDPGCRSIRDAKGTYFRDVPLAGEGRLAFLFPGEGSQYPGMLADLGPHFPELRAVLDTSDRIALERGHKNLPSEQLFGDAGPERAGLWDVGTAVNVVLSSQWALYQLLTRLGIKPGAVVGHSSGEFLAMAAAGVIRTDRELEDRLGDLGSVFEGLEAAGKVPVAALVAVAAERSRVEAACKAAGGSVVIAVDNCPHQVVMAGDPVDVAAVADRLRSQGVLLETLPFRRAYHTPWFSEALPPLRAFFRDLVLKPPAVPVYSCAVAGPMGTDPETIRRLAVDQWVSPVAFRSTVEAMHADGVRVFVEVGARGNLTGFVEDTLRGRPHLAVAANVPRRSGVSQLNHLVASLYAEGVAVDPAHLYARRRPCRVDLASDFLPPRTAPRPAAEFPEMRLSEALVERLAGASRKSMFDESRHRLCENGAETPHPPSGNGKAAANGHAERKRFDADSLQLVFEQAVIPTQPHTLKGPASRDEEQLLAHFETMDRFLETQRQVMEAYLGSRPVSNGRHDDHGTPSPRSAASEGATSPVLVPPGVDVIAHPDDVREVLLEQVSRRTGYPREMLDLDHDMEADLGIDSIKRVEILGELHARGVVPVGTDMETLSRCRTLGQIVAALDRARSKAAETPEAPLPWVGSIERHEPGRELVAVRWLDVRDDPVASHHTLGGRRISAVEPARLGLPVVPFTVMAELLAQAAAVLVPGKVVVGLRDVQANRWIAYDQGQPVALEVRARREPARPDEVRVTLRSRGARSATPIATDDPTVTGVVVFGDRRAVGPVAAPFTLDEPGPCRFTAEELYRDQWLFHGPALQALTRVGASSRQGIEGTIRVLPRRALLPERLWPTLHTDPIVLDAFTHLLGCWGLDKKAGEEGDVIFPLRVSSLTVFGDDPPEGSSVDCRIRAVEVSRHKVRVVAELVGPDGHVWLSLDGWEDWRFYWPDRYRDVFRQPDAVFVGELLELTGAGPGDAGRLAAVWLEPPPDMARPVWGDVLEWVQLSPGERAARQAGDDSGRVSVLERIAAKDAARRLWQGRGDVAVFPADLELRADPDGRLRVRSLQDPLRSDLPVVATAGAGGLALAIAALDPAARVGIAVERVDDRGEWDARLRAARRAAVLGPDGEVIGVDRSTGEIQVWPVDTLAVRCFTASRGEHVWAWTTFERTDP